MKILNHIFGKKNPNSTAIATEIEKARKQYDEALAKRDAALAGLGTMSDTEHIKAEADYEAHRRSADRAMARVIDLEKAHTKAFAAEAEAEKQAESEHFRARIEAARNAVEIEAAELFLAYNKHAAAIGDIFARLDEINAEARSCNEDSRRTPGFEPVRNTDTAHRKHPDRQASERREMRPVWVYPDGSEIPATLDGDGNPNRADPKWIHHDQKFAEPRLERRETVVARTTFRPGHYENSLSAIQLPPAFAGGAAHWPRK